MEHTSIHSHATTAGDLHASAVEHPADRIRIVSTPGVCGGRPRIDGHRIQVEDVAVWHERQGMSPDQILSEHPSLTLAEIYAALAYYHENRDRIDADLDEGRRYAAEMKANAGPSLLERKMRSRTNDAQDDPLSSR